MASLASLECLLIVLLRVCRVSLAVSVLHVSRKHLLSHFCRAPPSGSQWGTCPTTGHQVIRSPGHQVTRSPGHQVTRSSQQHRTAVTFATPMSKRYHTAGPAKDLH